MEDKKFELIRKWKEKIILDIIKNSSYHFIDKIEWLSDIWYEWESPDNCALSYYLLKVSFDRESVPFYCMEYINKLMKKYLKEDDSFWIFPYIKNNSFYIVVELYE